MDLQPFKSQDIPIATDPRVSPVLDTCLECGAFMPDSQTADDGVSMLLYVQCDRCRRVYMLDFSAFGMAQ